ncbi:MAG: 30S ribosomal protein S2 [Candidatus Paceibacterota bacterium]|jgi:small subunit ribosomal protein S2
MQKETKINEMFKAGAHFGYSKTRRHPSVVSYILTTKNKTDIVDLEKSNELLEKAKDFVKILSKEGKQILFLSVKPEAKKIMKDAAMSINMPYVTERWVGGVLTNFSEIKKRIAKLEDLMDKKEKGELDVYTKKERKLFNDQIHKMNKVFSGLIGLRKVPDVIFAIDSKKEKIAVTEAEKMKIPVISLSNTDCNMKDSSYPIIGNDASTSSIKFFVDEIIKAYNEGGLTSKE